MKNLLYVLLLLPVAVLGQDDTQNYVRTYTYRLATATSDPTKAQADVTYFDGMGRPIQQIAGKASESGKDIITHIEYDIYGRQLKDYLPYAASTNTLAFDGSAQANTLAYYNTSAYQNTTNPYSEKRFEASPLDRVLEQGAPGNSWAVEPVSDTDHTIKFAYSTNIAEEVELMRASASWSSTNGYYSASLSKTGGYYTAGQLYKTITKDENWTSGTNNTTEEFKNHQGQVVLKRAYNNNVPHDTYYVYDQYGNLSFVLPPLAEGTIAEGTCYYYRYDARNRLVEKRLPGGEWQFIVYDALDRVVATGPALSPFGDEAIGWMMNYYDAFNRVVATGWAPASGSPMTTAMRKALQDSNNGAVTNIARGANNYDGATIDYALTGNVATGFELLTLTYYDNYTWLTGVTPPSTIQSQTRLADVKGLVTGGWTRIVTTSADNYHELSYSFYDNKGRVLRARTNNTQLGGYSQTETKYDFDGDVAYTITKHKRVAADTEVTVREDFTYSAQDRLVSHTHKIGSAAAELMAYNTYNELGELTAKKVGNTDTAPLQSVSYRYNIRGWLTGINSTFDLGLETGPQDLFAFNINYNHSISNSMGGSVKSLYNGNIAETSWRTASDNIERRYGYSYDNLNRLAEAYYQIPYAAVPLRNSYNESLTYDKNGNIMSLNRNGGLDSATTVVEIDELTYTYDGTKKNQLIKVTDGSNSTQGFNNGTSSTNTDYTYDDFGNLKTDLNKGITSIKYNHLNLPVEVKFDNSDTKKINYIYNAAGVKLKKTVTDGGTVTATDYLNGFQYVNTVLEFFPTAEGYVKNTVVGSTNNYNYVYHYKDHLGNVRISYTVDPADSVLKILEENHYYPFGLKHESYSATQQMIRGVSGGGITIVPVTGPNDLTYNYRYQGQERQDELGLGWDSFKWRNYDPEIGRFMSVDPLAEKYAYQSIYQFSSNQPIHAPELEGLESRDDLNLRETAPTRTNDAIPKNTQLARTVQLAKSAPKAAPTPAREQPVLSAGKFTPEQRKANAAIYASKERAKNIVANHDNLGSPYTQNSVMVGAAYGALDVATGEVGGKVLSGLSNIVKGSGVNNPVPKMLARVVPGDVEASTLGAPNSSDVFVTAAEDISGMNASQISRTLTIPESGSGFKVIEFPTPSEGLSTPINRTNPGFINGGRTAGGAREFTIPNGPVPKSATERIVN